MENAYVGMVAGILILLASMASVELGLSVALIEIAFGVVAGNFLGLHTTPWLDFLASFASIVLTFLAGAEVDVTLMRQKLKESLVIGGISFAAPFFGAWAFCQFVLGCRSRPPSSPAWPCPRPRWPSSTRSWWRPGSPPTLPGSSLWPPRS